MTCGLVETLFHSSAPADFAQHPDYSCVAKPSPTGRKPGSLARLAWRHRKGAVGSA